MHGKVRDIDIMNSQKLDDICLENLMLKAVNIGWYNKISSNHLYKKTNKVHELYQKEMEYEKRKKKKQRANDNSWLYSFKQSTFFKSSTEDKFKDGTISIRV